MDLLCLVENPVTGLFEKCWTLSMASESSNETRNWRITKEKKTLNTRALKEQLLFIGFNRSDFRLSSTWSKRVDWYLQTRTRESLYCYVCCFSSFPSTLNRTWLLNKQIKRELHQIIICTWTWWTFKYAVAFCRCRFAAFFCLFFLDNKLSCIAPSGCERNARITIRAARALHFLFT